MVTIRRWWDRKGLQIGLLALVVGSAWVLRQTQGELVLETYQALTRPLEMLQSGPTPEERIRDARILELQTRIVDLESQKTKLQDLLGYVEKSHWHHANSSQGNRT